MEINLKSLIDKKDLKFIFVGGKGGVGKTTTSSSLACLLSKHRKKVMIISTDPAHNLSDAFKQKFSDEPTLVNGFDNLFAIEIDPKKSLEKSKFMDSGLTTEENLQFISELLNTFPGIDEIFAFEKMVSLMDELDIELIICDTAPTGHTLKLMKLPETLEKGFEKLINIKDKLQGILSTFGGGNDSNFLNKFDDLKEKSKRLVKIFKEHDKTTFIGVAIPEYLSVCETERLVQDLMTNDIDISNLVVNQIVIPESDCKKCKSRYKMQKKYIDMIFELYDDFNLALVPLQDEEIKGVEGLKTYGELLLNELKLPNIEN